MRGNFFGKMISIASFGESHGAAIGVVIDGVPAGLSFCKESLQASLDKRAPGKKGTSARQESDQVEILSGIYDNKTLGSPIAVIVRNCDCRSSDYDELKDNYRIGHADRTTMQKYGIRDHRGGGRASGRETIARVIGGYFSSLILPGLKVKSQITKIAGLDDIDNMESYLEKLRQIGDSAGGKIKVNIDGTPAGLGEPVFDKLKADLAKGLMSIGGCTSFSYGIGEDFADLMGSEAKSSHFGGIEGGISNGMNIELQLTFKPPSSVGKRALEGRHDPCIIPRVLPVVESMIKLVIVDHFLRQNGYESRRD